MSGLDTVLFKNVLTFCGKIYLCIEANHMKTILRDVLHHSFKSFPKGIIIT